MNRSQQDRLLTEILSGDEIAPFRRQSLEDSLGWLQQRHRRRRLFRTTIAASATFVLAAGLLWNHTREPQTLHSTANPHSPSMIASSVHPSTDNIQVKVITAQELFALFPNRPMALIGKPGHQRLVFLDQ